MNAVRDSGPGGLRFGLSTNEVGKPVDATIVPITQGPLTALPDTSPRWRELLTELLRARRLVCGSFTKINGENTLDLFGRNLREGSVDAPLFHCRGAHLGAAVDSVLLRHACALTIDNIAAGIGSRPEISGKFLVSLPPAECYQTRE